MFGYVTPYIPELKVKDYEKFKAYYCGLCRSIKKNIGNLPRAALNYDMTFLAILLDSLLSNKISYKKVKCLVHPFKKKVMVEDTGPIKYAGFCNIVLSYYKLFDDIKDDSSIKSKFLYPVFKIYMNKLPCEFKPAVNYIKKSLENLSRFENNFNHNSFDIICHPFSDLTAFILSNYADTTEENTTNLYWLGYNLGKWIYIIDALDDLKKDMSNNKFNPLNACFNNNHLCYDKFYSDIKNRADFLLGTCASQCLEFFSKLNVIKNKELLYNILQYGLLDKMDKVFKRGVYRNEKSL